MKERVHLAVNGRVQGVCFRYAARKQALRLGLTGYVRNRPDGSVEVVAEGLPDALSRLSAWCRLGPPGARVTGVREEFCPATGRWTTFDIER